MNAALPTHFIWPKERWTACFVMFFSPSIFFYTTYMLTIITSTHHVVDFWGINLIPLAWVQIDCWLQNHSLENKTFPGKLHIDGEQIISGPVGPFNILHQHWAMLSWLEWEDQTCKSTPLTCNVIIRIQVSVFPTMKIVKESFHLNV